ncbi:MAG TPA: trigger factor [Synechococcales bacterium UBA12195]|jgi:trigger factor|nr:MAG: trigger factor [Synechococcus sp. MED-G67]HCA60585.1 trigger factor [Synechococcales bacterium UBA8647]HCV56987.1 trigger factor [Synechococcales bacterium UBA12195]|tara:strand:- start:3925 stop:5379 length:1455 start_codon:yes stop_codon:yes gene_type:complete
MTTALKVKTSSLPGSRLALEVGVPAGRCKASYEAAVERLSRSVRLPGFRKGRVPKPVLLQQIGPLRVKASALEDLVDSVLRDAVEQEKVEVLGQPSLSGNFEELLEKFDPAKELVVTLEMDVAPTPTLKSTKGLSAEAESVAYDPARVDELLDQSRRQLATLVPVSDRAAAMGDVAVVSFSGVFSDDKSAIEGGSANGLDVELEEGRMISGFVEGVVGMKPGDKKDVDCQFPDDYPEETCRGRKALFSISLDELKGRELPALDDAFAQQASDKKTLSELREDLESRLKQDAEQRQKNNRHEALLKALVDQLEVELPESLIKEEINSLLQETAAQMAQQGMDVKKLFTPETVQNLAQASRGEATERLQRSLALKALAKAEGISVADKDLEAKIKEVSAGFSDTNKIDPQRLRDAVAEDLLRETLLSWLEENAKLTMVDPASEDKPAKASKAKSSKAKAEKEPAAEGQAKAKPAAKTSKSKTKAAE